jgi:hypothetical protein
MNKNLINNFSYNTQQKPLTLESVNNLILSASNSVALLNKNNILSGLNTFIQPIICTTNATQSFQSVSYTHLRAHET